MCEQTEVEYLDGDVVWVKLGSCWWPGEVQGLSKLPPEIVKDFKKQPIAVVKFFQEDQYEYVKNINHIYKYNCRKKNEFIKKGLDMHRAKNAFMDKFPADVCHAETLTGGDPDIITNDEFAPEQKPSYAAIFGTPKEKKSKTSGGRARASTGSTPKSRPSLMTPERRIITHPRFIGKSDHEVRILEQTTPVAQTSHYTCHICGFESSRLNVIVLHNRSHSNGTYVSPSKPKKKSSSKKLKRKSFATTNSIDEDLELIRQGVTVSTEETSESETDDVEKEKRKTGNKRKNNKAAITTTKKAKVSSICNNLLADWGDSDEDMDETDKTDEISKTDSQSSLEKKDDIIKTDVNKSVQNELLADWDDKNSDDEDSTKNSSAVSDDKKTNTKASEEKSSCFDFQDEEENAVLEKSPGRKIPRVLPSKRISKDTEDSTEEKEVEKMNVESSEETQNDENKEPDIAAFNSLLEETAVPDISSIPEMSSDKIDKKFDDSSSIDKTNGVMTSKQPEPEMSNEIVDNDNNSKESEPVVATVPKKRIVRNFEEFENLHNEQKNVEEQMKSKSTLEVSKLKSQLMSKLNESSVKKSPVHRIETPEVDSEIDSKTEEEESQSSESFKKISQSESEDTDMDKKDTISLESTSKDLDFSETPEEKSVESETMEECKEEEETVEPVVAEMEVEKETVLEESTEKSEVSEVPMEIETTVESLVEPLVEQPVEPSVEPLIESSIDPSIEPVVEPSIEPPGEPSSELSVEPPGEPSPELSVEPVIEEKVDNMEQQISEEIIPEEKMEEEPIVEETAKEVEVEEFNRPVIEEELVNEEILSIPEEKPESPKTEEETETIIEESKVEENIQETQEVQEIPEVPEIQESVQKTEETRSQKMLVDISDICIDNADNLSGLSTLAAVSELTGNLYDKQEPISQEYPTMEPETKEDGSTIDEITNPPSSVTDDPESRDMTPVQDELPDTPTPQAKPIQTLANFSMDFSDSNSESTIIKTVAQEDVTEKVVDNIETSVSTTDSEECKIEICEPEKPVTQATVSAEVPTDFESIESEIEKITSMETTSDKLNSFPENISEVPQDSGITYSDFQLADTGTTIPGSGTTEFMAKMNESVVPPETTLESEIAKLTDTHPDTENVVQEQQQNTTSSKLLEILTDSKRTEQIPVGLSSPVQRTIIKSGSNQKVQMVISGDTKSIPKKFDPKTSKFVIKSATSKGGKSNKPIILSEKIIKPVSEVDNISVKKVTSKRTFQDVEDIDTFIIQKPTKKSNSGELDQQDIILTPKSEAMKFKTGIQRSGRGKPKIIEQTIIKAADVVQPTPIATTSESTTLLDDSMFDINSMPIVLSDQILTPESIENMPMVMTDIMPTSSVTTANQSTVQTVIAEKPQQQTIAVKRGGAIQQVKLLNKGKVTSQPESSPKLSQNVVVKNIMPRGLSKNQKVYQTGSKTLKNNPAVITQPGKPGKFIILPSSTATTTGVSKYTVGKRLTTIKSSTPVTNPTTSKQIKSVQGGGGEPSGNKIMIVTNQQGVQSRVLLTPAQQKLLGCKVPGTKIGKSQIKSGIMQKSILTSKGTIIGSVNSSGIKSPNVTSQTLVTSKGQMVASQGQMIVTSEGQVLTPISQQQLKSNMHKSGQKIKIQSSRVILPDKSGEAKSKMNLMGTKTKTVLIKGAQGQTLKKIQTAADTKNILLSQGGQKQLVSLGGQQISSNLSGKQVVLTSKGQVIKSENKIGIPKQTADKLQRVQSPKTSVATPPRIMTKSSRTQVLLSPSAKQQMSSVPPLAPITGQTKKEIHAKQVEQKLLTTVTEKEKSTEASTTQSDKTSTEQKQPNQLIIQDAMGNQTTVTEGQILALPSGETVDGQPQSYVLVTVDETGNLVPISNDTLMSLDPSFAAGGDMNNIVLQIDPGAQENQTQESKPAENTLSATDLPVEEQLVTNQQIVETQEQMLVDNQQLMLQEENVLPTVVATTAETQVLQEPETFVATTTAEETQVVTSDATNLLQDTQQTAVACSINNGDSSQQLIITGDPESTQKFLASLSEGNTDLSSLLSGTDGNIIINTDGQQILLNTDSDNQILLSVNSDNLGLIQGTSESDPTQNAMYVTQQAIKNQDILAAALADTDVFQQEAADKHNASQALTKASTSAQSQLSPNSSLYPMNVGNVLETSLTLGSPIMTPLEVPSVNNKKINSDVESTLITQVPSSLELPITITDPSISQTVSQQVMLGNDLQTNLELPISISDNTITSIRSSELNSPNFVYSLPTLDDNSDLEQKTSTVITSDNIYNTSLAGSMSMPLLTEEPEIQPVEQEQVTTTSEETPIVTTTSAPEKSTTETVISESDQSSNFTNLNTDNLPTTTTVPEKMPSELQITIEEELDLNPTDICSSLSEPPPGMFDKSSFSNFLNKSEEETTIEAIPQETETPPTTNESVLSEPINSLPILSDGADPTTEVANSDTLTTEKSAEDIDYGVSESSDQPNISETVMTQEVQRSELLETPNSDLNSPRLDIDENSVEIPIQPVIVTNLGENYPENENTTEDFNSQAESSKKRVNDDEIDDENDAKRTKISCD